jgi:hypothetical protein
LWNEERSRGRWRTVLCRRDIKLRYKFEKQNLDSTEFEQKLTESDEVDLLLILSDAYQIVTKFRVTS